MRVPPSTPMSKLTIAHKRGHADSRLSLHAPAVGARDGLAASHIGEPPAARAPYLAQLVRPPSPPQQHDDKRREVSSRAVSDPTLPIPMELDLPSTARIDPPPSLPLPHAPMEIDSQLPVCSSDTDVQPQSMPAPSSSHSQQRQAPKPSASGARSRRRVSRAGAMSSPTNLYSALGQPTDTRCNPDVDDAASYGAASDAELPTAENANDPRCAMRAALSSVPSDIARHQRMPTGCVLTNRGLSLSNNVDKRTWVKAWLSQGEPREALMQWVDDCPLSPTQMPAALQAIIDFIISQASQHRSSINITYKGNCGKSVFSAACASLLGAGGALPDLTDA